MNRLLRFIPIFCLMIIFLSLPTHASNSLLGVQKTKEDGHIVATYEFTKPVNLESIVTEVQDKAVQIIIPDGVMASDKNLVSVDEDGVKSIFTTLEPQGQIRSRVIFDTKIVNFDEIKNSVRFVLEMPAWARKRLSK